MNFFSEKSLNAEKTERATFWDFSTSILLQNSETIEGRTFGDNFFPKKMSTMPKNTGRYFTPGIVCYAENLFGSVPWANRYILATP